MGYNPSDIVSSILNAQLNKRRLIQKPSGLGWTPSILFYRDTKTGQITASTDLSTFQITGKTYYVTTSGVDTNDGLTEATAFRTLGKAISMSDVSVILIKAGVYSRSSGTMGTTSPSRNISIKGYGGEVVLSCHDSLSWTVTGGYTGVYQASRTTVEAVYDHRFLDVYGDAIRLTKRNSIAEVDATAGSWYTDGTIVYVKTSDVRAPDSNVRAYLSVNNGYIAGGITAYLEGLTFEGGKYACQIINTSSNAIPTVYAKNCKFKYASLTNSLSVLGAITYMQDCVATGAMNDGFNYHANLGVICKFVEINCIGRNNGYGGGDNNNGSTSHDSSFGVRVGGKYFGNNGPNVVDVNGSQSWNIGCIAWQSTGATTQNVNFYIDGTMWLDSCVSVMSTTDLRVNPGTMYTRNVKTMGVNSVTAGSSLLEY